MLHVNGDPVSTSKPATGPFDTAFAGDTTCRVDVGVVVPMPTLPFWAITNLLRPEDEAVKISPTPDWSMMREAEEVLPEIVATGRVPEVVRRSRVPRRLVLPPRAKRWLVAS